MKYWIFLLILIFTNQGYSISANEINNDLRVNTPEFETLDTIWPINKSTWSQDIRLLSTFGPRLKISENYRYDFHRGIDIPGDFNTPVFAIADGLVRLVSINETHQQRSDGSIDKIYTSSVIQIKHNNTAKNAANGKTYYYSNYLHINYSRVEVKAGQMVTKGQVIGYIGDDINSHTPHLHFEIRENGLKQKNAVHPLRFIPNNNEEKPLLTDVSVNKNVLNFTISVGEKDLDFLGFNLTGSIDNQDFVMNFDLEQLNQKNNDWLTLDNNTISIGEVLITIKPATYTISRNIPYANYNFQLSFPSFIKYNLILSAYDIFNSHIDKQIINNQDITDKWMSENNKLVWYSYPALIWIIIPYIRKQKSRNY